MKKIWIRYWWLAEKTMPITWRISSHTYCLLLLLHFLFTLVYNFLHDIQSVTQFICSSNLKWIISCHANVYFIHKNWVTNTSLAKRKTITHKHTHAHTSLRIEKYQFAFIIIMTFVFLCAETILCLCFFPSGYSGPSPLSFHIQIQRNYFFLFVRFSLCYISSHSFSVSVIHKWNDVENKTSKLMRRTFRKAENWKMLINFN